MTPTDVLERTDAEFFEDVAIAEPETALERNEHKCAACGHARKRHISGRFSCCETVETRVLHIREGDLNTHVLCACNEFKERA